MKKAKVLVGLAVVIGLIISSNVYAWRGEGCYNRGYVSGANVESVKKFQKETLNLRDELITKQLELQSEYDKSNPEINRIATLKKEIIDLKAKIQSAAEKYGLPAFGLRKGDGRMGRGMGYCCMCQQ